MSGQNPNSTAMMVARGVGAEIAFNSSGGAEAWIMLMPIGDGGLVATVDGRGPYRVTDPAKLAASSLQAHDGRIPIDENHSTDLAAPRGEPAPARGWAVELQARPGGIYGRVEWSASGSALMAEKAYRYISPVIVHAVAGTILDLPRASLTNTPNLRGMSALHSQENDNMDLLASLIKLLGLPDGSDAAAVIAAVKKECGDDPATTATQSIALAAGLGRDADRATVLATVKTLKAGTSLASIAKAAGLKDDADAPAIVTAITALASANSGDAAKTIVALQGELKELGEKLNTSLASTAKNAATAFVDNAIKAGHVGVKPLRDHYIAMHAADPARVEKEINALPKVGLSGTLEIPPETRDGEISLNFEQQTAAKLLGVDPKAYAKTLAAERSAAA